MQNEKVNRELTRNERKEIRQLVVNMCANHDYEYGCLPLDCACYMLNKWYTGAYCRYFNKCVLPLKRELETSLANTECIEETKSCAVCGDIFTPEGRKLYCSEICRTIGTRDKEKRKKRNQRKKQSLSVPI